MDSNKNTEDSKSNNFVGFITFLLLISTFALFIYKKFINKKTDWEDLFDEEDFSEDIDLKEEDSSEDDSSMVVMKPERKKIKKEKESIKSTKSIKTDELSERQKEIYDFVKSNKSVDSSILNARFKDVTVRTIRRDLGILVDKGLIKKNGETKGVTYSVL